MIHMVVVNDFSSSQIVCDRESEALSFLQRFGFEEHAVIHLASLAVFSLPRVESEVEPSGGGGVERDLGGLSRAYRNLMIVAVKMEQSVFIRSDRHSNCVALSDPQFFATQVDHSFANLQVQYSMFRF